MKQLMRVIDINNPDDLEHGYNEWVDYWDGDDELVNEEFALMQEVIRSRVSNEACIYVALPVYVDIPDDSIDDENLSTVWVHDLSDYQLVKRVVYIYNHKRYCYEI